MDVVKSPIVEIRLNDESTVLLANMETSHSSWRVSYFWVSEDFKNWVESRLLTLNPSVKNTCKSPILTGRNAYFCPDMHNVNFFHRWKFQSTFLPQKSINYNQKNCNKTRKSPFICFNSQNLIFFQFLGMWTTLAVKRHWGIHLPQSFGHFRVRLVGHCGEIPSSPAKDPDQCDFP